MHIRGKFEDTKLICDKVEGIKSERTVQSKRRKVIRSVIRQHTPVIRSMTSTLNLLYQ